jgi:hypothetical protein
VAAALGDPVAALSEAGVGRDALHRFDRGPADQSRPLSWCSVLGARWCRTRGVTGSARPRRRAVGAGRSG